MRRSVKTTCPYCGVGCGVVATPQKNGEIKIEGDPDHPANFGRLCSKGTALGETISLENRLLDPEIDGQKAGWDDALTLVANNFQKTIKEHGPDSVAFYVSGQILTEDYYVANKLMKGFFGSANIDTNSRLCMASSVAGHKRAFGSDTVPGMYEDLELAELLVVVGSNLAWCHPVLYQRIAAAKAKRPATKIVVIDPRRTVTADFADLHLAIKPDGDTALFNGLLVHLARNGTVDSTYIESFTNGFDQALDQARLGADRIEEETGLSDAELQKFFHLFASQEKTVTVFSQGVNQSSGGTDKVNAIINCHLATGRIGKPGAGPFSVTGQPNAMGGREVGGLANMLAAHMDINHSPDRALVSQFWNAPNLASKPGLKAVDMFEAVGDGRIKALWIMGTNPVDSMPEASSVEIAIANCPFVVVSDVVAQTDTIRHANVKLPSAAWGEKSGTVTNSERCISRQRSFLKMPGDAKPDWWQLVQVAQRMGFNGFGYEHPVQVFREHAQLSAFKNNGERDFDIGSMSELSTVEYVDLKPFRWPARSGEPTSTRMFEDGNYFTPDGKARFTAISNAIIQEENNSKYLRINTGRIRDQWHTMTRTGRSPSNAAHLAEPFCEIHPEDAIARGISDACIVSLKNQLGSISVRALISSRQQKGTVFVPIHWTDQFASDARVDQLVASEVDPVSGQPALKASYAELSVVPMKQYGFLVSKTKPKLNLFDYWAIAKTKMGWRAEFASKHHAFSMKYMFPELSAADVHVADAHSGVSRWLWFDDRKLDTAIFSSSTPVSVSRSWACEQQQIEHSIKNRSFLAYGHTGPDQEDQGAIVCSCFNVGVNQIISAIDNGCDSVKAIGEACKAGTNCGSCQAELHGYINNKVMSHVK